MDTPTDVDLSDNWLNIQSNVVASDQLSYPFAIVTDQHKCQKTNAPGPTPVINNSPIPASELDNSPGDSSIIYNKTKQIKMHLTNLKILEASTIV